MFLSFSYVASLREKLEWEYFPRANEEVSSSVFRFFFFYPLLALSDQPGAEEVTGSVSRVLYGTIFYSTRSPCAHSVRHEVSEGGRRWEIARSGSRRSSDRIRSLAADLGTMRI